MFIQYYRYRSRYRCEQLRQDPHLKIAYPADEHGMITAAHDFYVIGNFVDCTIDEAAVLTVELVERESGNVVRTVRTNRKNGPLLASYSGIVSEETAEAIGSSGMPDLAYDPEDAASIGYTWNKAYYCDTGFSALIYGGSFGRDRICQNDQFGNPLKPLAEGFYEVRVTLENAGEQYVSSKTIRLATGQKEIVLSRFSPKEHVEIVERFVQEQGFEPFTDPYAGIWDPQYFSCPWHSDAYIEIPERWHWGDAQEYESGVVHCFQHNISEACVSYRIEIANMLRQSADCVNQPDRLRFYYYPAGKAALERTAGEQLALMPPGRYAFFTGMQRENGMLRVRAAFKPIPSAVEQIQGCEYRILNRIARVDYILHGGDGACIRIEDQQVGIRKQKEDQTEEYLVLESEHALPLQDLRGDISLCMIAKDLSGKIWDSIRAEIPQIG